MLFFLSAELWKHSFWLTQRPTASCITCKLETGGTQDCRAVFRCSWDAVTRRHKPFLEPCDAFHAYGHAVHTSTILFVTLWRITKEIAICISIGHCLNILIHMRVRSSNSASLTSLKHQRIAGYNLCYHLPLHVYCETGCVVFAWPKICESIQWGI